jgi:ubiquinone/menaquinone biosynthesis C-methylase UbiE
MSASDPILFNPLPSVYDEVMGPLYFEAYASETANRIAALNPANVLETACGTGRLSIHLRKLIRPAAHLNATDVNRDMLEYAKNKFAETKGIAWSVEDAIALSFGDNTFDAMCCQFGAMFFSDKRKGFTEAYRVLKNNSTCIFTVWDKLETNPLSACTRELVQRYFKGDPPAGLRTAYSLSDAEAVKDLMKSCGFHNIIVEYVNRPCEIESAAIFAEAFIHGSAVREILRRESEKSVNQLKNDITTLISRTFGDHPVRSTMQAIYFTAQKD